MAAPVAAPGGLTAAGVMDERGRLHGRYDHTVIAVNEIIWGEGFMSPGGTAAVRAIVAGLDLEGLTVLDIGCGIGGVDRLLADAFGCRVIGLDIEPLLIEVGRARMAAAGLAGRVDLRLVEPGPLPLGDAVVDVVFGKDSWLLIEDKPVFFSEVFRVLRPGGALRASEWMGDGRPPSAELRAYFALRGITYDLTTASAYRDMLGAAGFVGVEATDTSDAYQADSRHEHDRMQGPLRAAMIDAMGAEKQAHFVAMWAAMTRVLDTGELRTGRLGARKPG